MAISNFGLNPPKKGGMPPPSFGPPKKTEAPAGPPSRSASAPVDDLAGGPPAKTPPDRASGQAVPPEAVCYRSEVETCGSCTYNNAGNCDRLQMPVADGDGCNLFEGRGGDMDLDSGPEEAMEEQI